jgi:N-acetyl-anhydromuramyl-L-alanine amidase AmpD
MRFAGAIETTTPYKTARPLNASPRTIRGVVLHHTATTRPCEPHAGGSWHYLVTRDGQIVAPIDEQDVAWHVASTDRWRPSWVANTAPWFTGSDINSCSIGIEIVSHPQFAPGYTEPQMIALERLLSDIVGRRGDLWIVGHGEVQSDRSDPASFPWDRICGARDAGNGRRLKRSIDMTDDQRQILDACDRHGLKSAEDVDQLMGRYDLLAQQVASLEHLLHEAQRERDALYEGREDREAQP